MADAVYRNGKVYTVDARDSIQQAIAIKSGRLAFAGSDSGVGRFIGPTTTVQDLQGRVLMPGLIDGHMHPLAGGATLLKCNLNYERLTIGQMQGRIQRCLDQTPDREPDGWLEVVNWFQEGMQGGTGTTSATLEALRTKRPIMVMSSFHHTALVNTRALNLAHLTDTTPDPVGGKIERNAAGHPSGILQDAAFEQIYALMPKPTPEENVRAAEAALDALKRQGVTTFLDAAADSSTLTAFAAVEQAGKLTARAHFAVWISPPEGKNPKAAVARAVLLARKYDQGDIRAQPRMTVRNTKLFLDGVIAAPALTGAMLRPYFDNKGTKEHPQWVPGANRGPEVYFPAPILRELLSQIADAGLEPHMHADGDRAVHEALDAIEWMRKQHSPQAIRAAIAHDEIVDPSDFPRFAALDAVPVLSFQWERPAPDTVDGARDYLGPARYRYIEPAAFLSDAGARIAFGSDWPVDPLDEWFALKAAVTRTDKPGVEPHYPGRLGEDRGLSRKAALRAITLNAAYELHQDETTGSLEPGKLADFIIIDRDFLQIPADEIAAIKVLKTVVGGQVVYDAASTSDGK